VGCDYPCMSFVYSCVFLLVVFLASCISIVGGASYAYMSGFLVDWVRMCFEFMC